RNHPSGGRGCTRAFRYQRTLRSNSNLARSLITLRIAVHPFTFLTHLLLHSLTRTHTRTRSLCSYSGFDSAPYRNLDAEWHFPQENATLHDLQMSTSESKPL